MKDMYNELQFVLVADDAVIDRAGYESVTFGVNASVASTFNIQESDISDSGFADVDASDYLGKEVEVTDGTGVHKFGYRGNKRYLKLIVGANITGMCALGNHIVSPV